MTKFKKFTINVTDRELVNRLVASFKLNFNISLENRVIEALDELSHANNSRLALLAKIASKSNNCLELAEEIIQNYHGKI